jgi:hypothetical protein
MVYSFGKTENGDYDVIVDVATGAGGKKLEILSESAERVVDLGTLRNPWRFKHFEQLSSELLKGMPDNASVYFTESAVKVIKDYLVGNRVRYANRPLEKFSMEPQAPALIPV